MSLLCHGHNLVCFLPNQLHLLSPANHTGPEGWRGGGGEEGEAQGSI